jgi:integrase
LEDIKRNIVDYTTDKIRDTSYLNAIPTEVSTFERHFNRKQRKTVLEFLTEYIAIRKGNSVRGTWKEFRTLYGRLEGFQESNNQVLFFENINYDFADQLRVWAKKEELDPNTLKKTFDALSTFLNHYYDDQNKLNFILADHFRNRKFKVVSGTHSSEPSPLYPNEIKALINFTPTKPIKFKDFDGKDITLTVNGQYRVKNLFLLSCFTGIRFSDVLRLTKGSIQGDHIVFKASKTDTGKSSKTLYIPILEPVKDIMKEIKYDISKIKLVVADCLVSFYPCT